MNFWLSVPVPSVNLRNDSVASSLGYNSVPCSLMPVSGDLQGDDSLDTSSSFWKKKKKRKKKKKEKKIHIIVTIEE